MSEKITKAEARRRMAEGSEWFVTNHYITRKVDAEGGPTTGKDAHPCYGTTRRTMAEVDSASFGFVRDDDYRDRLAFSRFGFGADDDGTLYVFGCPDDPQALFLTMEPVEGDLDTKTKLFLGDRETVDRVNAIADAFIKGEALSTWTTEDGVTFTHGPSGIAWQAVRRTDGTVTVVAPDGARRVLLVPEDVAIR